MSSAENSLGVMALETDESALRAVRAAVEGGQISLLATVGDLASLIAAARERQPAVVLMDLAHAGPDTAIAVRSVLAAAPESCIVVTGANATPAIISRAVSAGARGFILRPFEAHELTNTISDAYANLTELRGMQRGDAAAPQDRGKIIAVYSPKGGVGCTTIATNLAVALISRSKRRIALVDLDLQFGDVGVALDLHSANSVVDLVAHGDDFDATLVEDVFVRHESGIRALLAPEHVSAADTADPDRIVRAIEKLRDHFAYVVCDLWSSLDDLTLGVLRAADRVILVTTPELPALKNIRRATAATSLLADDRTQIVLNRYPGKAGVSVADVERNLGRRVSATIASEGVGVTDAINQGISMFDSRARVRAGPSYLKLADQFLHGSPAHMFRAATATAATRV